MERFRLIHEIIERAKENRIIVNNVPKKYPYSVVCVGILREIKDISPDLRYQHQRYQNDMTVIKMLLKNKEGIYYMKRVGQSFRSKMVRTFLTEEEVEGLNKFIEYIES